MLSTPDEWTIRGQRDEADGFVVDLYGTAILGLVLPWIASFIGGIWLFLPAFAFSLYGYWAICRSAFRDGSTPYRLYTVVVVWAAGVFLGAPCFWSIGLPAQTAVGFSLLILAYVVRPNIVILESNKGESTGEENARTSHIATAEEQCGRENDEEEELDGWPHLSVGSRCSPPLRGQCNCDEAKSSTHERARTASLQRHVEWPVGPILEWPTAAPGQMYEDFTAREVSALREDIAILQSARLGASSCCPLPSNEPIIEEVNNILMEFRWKRKLAIPENAFYLDTKCEPISRLDSFFKSHFQSWSTTVREIPWSAFPAIAADRCKFWFAECCLLHARKLVKSDPNHIFTVSALSTAEELYEELKNGGQADIAVLCNLRLRHVAWARDDCLENVEKEARTIEKSSYSQQVQLKSPKEPEKPEKPQLDPLSSYLRFEQRCRSTGREPGQI